MNSPRPPPRNQKKSRKRNSRRPSRPQTPVRHLPPSSRTPLTAPRYAPRGIRRISLQLYPHSFDSLSLMPPFNQLRVVDYGDIETYPGYIEQSLKKFQEELVPIFKAGGFPVCLGGDHTIPLSVLRAAAQQHGTP